MARRWLCAWKESAKNFGIASAVPEGYWIHSPLILARRRLESSFFRQGICLQLSSFFRQGMCLRDIYFSSEYVLFRARSAPLEKEGVRCKKMNEWKGDEMIRCYQLTHQQQCMSKGRQRERYHRQPGWLATDSAPHHCGSEGNKSKNQVWRLASDPLPLWLTWEWQDNAILQANPFSYQLTRLPRMELWCGIGLKPGFVLGWAGTNQFPILKPA